MFYSWLTQLSTLKTSSSTTCKKPPVLRYHSYTKNASFYQDRLGTNIGKILKKWRFHRCRRMLNVAKPTFDHLNGAHGKTKRRCVSFRFVAFRFVFVAFCQLFCFANRFDLSCVICVCVNCFVSPARCAVRSARRTPQHPSPPPPCRHLLSAASYRHRHRTAATRCIYKKRISS